MNDLNLYQAAKIFGFSRPDIERMTSGLIHDTYKVCQASKCVILQSINTAVFTEPDKIIRNYLAVFNYLEKTGDLKIPELIRATTGNFLFTDEAGKTWRATQFISGSYIESLSLTPEQAQKAARCFGEFSRLLTGLKDEPVEEVIEGFHNLAWRFAQFETALAGAHPHRIAKSKPIIESVQQRKWLVNFYISLKENPGFPLRIMHHDCKISNILFDSETKNPVCPIDLDTVMPGYFFSDIGDLIRSLAGTVSEISLQSERLLIRQAHYEAILNGYLSGMGETLTPSEKKVIHLAGPLMTYMQCLRFLTDYLEGDTYYKTTYPEQNLNRCTNQLHLLVKLEEFLKARFNYPIPF